MNFCISSVFGGLSKGYLSSTEGADRHSGNSIKQNKKVTSSRTVVSCPNATVAPSILPEWILALKRYVQPLRAQIIGLLNHTEL